MPLINCPVCRRQISAEAESCPQCGHPNRAAARVPKEPSRGSGSSQCSSCEKPATRACTQCGTFCCDEHISVFLGKGVLCSGCWRGWAILAALGIIGGIAMLIFMLVKMSELGQ